MKSLQFNFYKYNSINNWRGFVEMTMTLAPLILGIYIMNVAINNNYWPLYFLTLPLGLLFTRLFIILHDLAHGNLFKPKRYNDRVGMFIGILLLTPFYFWQKAHTIHHSSGGNTDKRPWKGDIQVLTVNEYRNKKKLQQIAYQLYRNSLVMFVLGSIYVFMIEQRIFIKRKGFGKKEHRSIILTNIGVLILYGLIIILCGIKFYLLAILVPQWIGGIVGIYLFYVQHNFKNRYFVPGNEWSLKNSALLGSTFYALPQPLKWLTGNIGYHHIHTLVPRIPFYNLPKCHIENPIFHTVSQFGLKDMNTLISLKLYDESKGHMITWKEYHSNYPSDSI
ncbi:fatty acid desaturase family protein [Legionella quateirensis]|uniref:Fatty acid desaturase n=2 Tax=Legionella quateirensis TaxID=45072 RepID=A0ABR5RP87_9GAMM|nr:fatty acid desaturase [Legionella quateirensis]KTD51301.1 fatty acid desaturase [Legionella quateirensis]